MKLQFKLTTLIILAVQSIAFAQTGSIPLKIYTDKINGFSIKYPSTWKSKGGKAAFMCGKKEGLENAEWLLLFSDVNNKERIDMLFNDRDLYKNSHVITKKITINGLEGVHSIITTKGKPDEYLETIVIKTNTTWYYMMNNGIKNANFHLFYESFKLIK